jgi:hypothetical protein
MDNEPDCNYQKLGILHREAIAEGQTTGRTAGI